MRPKHRAHFRHVHEFSARQTGQRVRLANKAGIEKQRNNNRQPEKAKERQPRNKAETKNREEKQYMQRRLLTSIYKPPHCPK